MTQVGFATDDITNSDTLKSERIDKIKSLGFLCYNLYVDGTLSIPEISETADGITKTLNYLMVLRQNNFSPYYIQMQEESLNEKLTELGCVCYNLYVDNKMINLEVLSLCGSISSINREISGGNNDYRNSLYSGGSHVGENIPFPKHTYETETHQGNLKVACPYGMEHIPPNYKKCVCGYRNRPEAIYCAKCGAKLP